MRLGNPDVLWFLLGIPLLVLLFVRFNGIAGKRLQRFAGSGALPKLIKSKSVALSRWKFSLFAAAAAVLIIALARPQIGVEPMQVKRAGVDILVALDTSYSMAAEDIPPSRLAKAKREIERLADSFGGDRLGLLLFAGGSSIECPLTWDISTFKMFLNGAGFNSVQRGGSDISGAIRKGVASFSGSVTKSKVVVLVTDGEDHEGDPISEAKKAAEEGVKIYTLGLGSDKGAPIPMRDKNGSLIGYKKDARGEIILTRQNSAQLHEIALYTDAVFVSSQNGGMDITPIIESIHNLDKSDITSTRFTSYVERFQILLAFAVLLLFIEWII
ncbi:MAG: hypothetical protein IEMM0002_1252 [bacterium]|nr:MAG: hypothetical protein IEMM0002_1252 [bacterium]